MRGRDAPLYRGGIVAMSLLAVALVLLAGSPQPTHPPESATPAFLPAAQSPSWSNGVVRLDFPNERPTFTLSSMTNSSVTANQSLSGLAEIGTGGAIVSFASFDSPASHWTFSAAALPGSINITAIATVVAVASGGAWESGDYPAFGGEFQAVPAQIGSANVTIDFQLNASNRSNPSSVTYDLGVTGWPWLRSNDSLGIEVRSNYTATPGRWAVNGSYGLTEFAPTGSQPLANFDWAANATAMYSGGLRSHTSVGSYHNFSTSGGNFLLRLQFGSVTGGYTSLAYDPTLTLLIPPAPALAAALPAWLLTTAAIEVLAASVAASLVLAAVAGRWRHPPEEGL